MCIYLVGQAIPGKSVVDTRWRHPFDPLLVAGTRTGSLPGTQRRKRCEFGAPSEKAVFGSELASKAEWSSEDSNWKIEKIVANKSIGEYIYIDKPALKENQA